MQCSKCHKTAYTFIGGVCQECFHCRERDAIIADLRAQLSKIVALNTENADKVVQLLDARDKLTDEKAALEAQYAARASLFHELDAICTKERNRADAAEAQLNSKNEHIQNLKHMLDSAMNEVAPVEQDLRDKIEQLEREKSELQASCDWHAGAEDVAEKAYFEAAKQRDEALALLERAPAEAIDGRVEFGNGQLWGAWLAERDALVVKIRGK